MDFLIPLMKVILYLMDNNEGTNISFYLNDLCQTVRMACAVYILIYNGYYFPFSWYKFLNNWILLRKKRITEKICEEMDPGRNRHQMLIRYTLHYLDFPGYIKKIFLATRAFTRDKKVKTNVLTLLFLHLLISSTKTYICGM